MGNANFSALIGTILLAVSAAGGIAYAQSRSRLGPVENGDQSAPRQTAQAQTVQGQAKQAEPLQQPRPRSNIGARTGFPETRAPVRREVEPKPRRIVRKRAPEAVPANGTAAAPPPTPPSQPIAITPTPQAAPAAVAAGAVAAQPASLQPPVVPVAAGWSPEDIKQAKLHCDGLLRGVAASYAVDDPIRQGECGSPVVYRVTGVGKGPEVQLNPPAIMTCEMIASLEKWVRQDVQPQARSLLRAPVIRIETMSSYSCRNAYGRARTRLSEHGRANALDIAGFSTAQDAANVLAHWGPTLREQRAIAARIEAERAAEAAQAAKARERGQNPTITGSTPPQPMPGVIIAPMPALGRYPGAIPTFTGPPAHLGGPAAKDRPHAALPALPEGGRAAPKAAPKIDPRSTFLREIHARACKHFGTVLGPEANNAHKNHFHVDMAPRRRGNFCE